MYGDMLGTEWVIESFALLIGYAVLYGAPFLLILVPFLWNDR